MDKSLIKGRFYWVRVVSVGRPGRALAGSWQPARYTGKSADTIAVERRTKTRITIVAVSPETWDFIGQRSEDGHHFVDVVEVGDEIVRPIAQAVPKRAKKAVEPKPSRSRKRRRRGG